MMNDELSEAALFRLELRTVSFYKKKIKTLEDKLKYISNELCGLVSFDYSSPVIENKDPRSSNYRRATLLDEEVEIQKEIASLQEFINKVTAKLEKLDPLTVVYVTDLYLLTGNGNHDDIAIRHGYANRNCLYRVVNHAIDDAFSTKK